MCNISEEMDEEQPSNQAQITCGGTIIFNSRITHVGLVESFTNVLGFFKGGREKYENTIFETQIREQFEESGLRPEDVLYVDNSYVDELTKDGKPRIRYLIAKTKPEFDNFKFVFDKIELQSAKWYELLDALTHRNLYFPRRDALRRARDIILSNTNLIGGNDFCKKNKIDFDKIM